MRGRISFPVNPSGQPKYLSIKNNTTQKNTTPKTSLIRLGEGGFCTQRFILRNQIILLCPRVFPRAAITPLVAAINFCERSARFWWVECGFSFVSDDPASASPFLTTNLWFVGYQREFAIQPFWTAAMRVHMCKPIKREWTKAYVSECPRVRSEDTL